MDSPAQPDKLAILILAAGRSSRMQGRDKLLEPVGGAPLVATLVARARKTGAKVFVALPRVLPVFEANPYLNGFIFIVFIRLVKNIK